MSIIHHCGINIVLILIIWIKIMLGYSMIFDMCNCHSVGPVVPDHSCSVSNNLTQFKCYHIEANWIEMNYNMIWRNNLVTHVAHRIHIEHDQKLQFHLWVTYDCNGIHTKSRRGWGRDNCHAMGLAATPYFSMSMGWLKATMYVWSCRRSQLF